MGFVVISAKNKKCATCNYWKNDGRQLMFANNKLYNVKAPTGYSPCLAYSNSPRMAGTGCSRWAKWVGLS